VGPDLFIDEGGVGDFIRSGSFNDPAGLTPHSAEVDYDDSAGFIGLTLTGNSFDLNHTYSTVDDASFVVTVNVTNSFPDVASDSAVIVINNVAPVVDAGTDGAANAGDAFTRSGSFTDPGTADTWTATVDYGDGDGPEVLALTGNTFDLSHTYNADADPEDDVYTVTVVVTDDDGGMGSASFDVTVSENVEPQVAADAATVTVNEGETATNTGTYSDTGGDTVTITASVGTVTQTGTDSGTWSWSYPTTDGPDETQTVTITATDSFTAVSTTTFALTVNNVAPTLGVDSATVTVDEGDTAINTGTFADIGADIVAVSASVGTVTQVGTQSGTWSWSFGTSDGPEDGQTVTVTATDSDGAFSTLSFALVVNNVAPDVAADNATRTFTEGETATNTGTFDDPGLDVVTISASVGTVSQVGSQIGTWSWSFPTTDGPDDSQTVTVTATDSDGAVNTTTFALIVDNFVPAVSTGGDVTISEGDTFSRPGTFVDPGDDAPWTVTVDYGEGAGPQPIAIIPPKAFALNNTYEQDGIYSVISSVTDSDGDTGVASITVTVLNLPPLVNADNPSVTVNEGQPAGNTGTFSDFGDDVVTISTSVGTVTQAGSQSGTWNWSFNSTDGPDESQTVVITANDNDGGVSTVSFPLVVNNVAPGVAADNASVTVNESQAAGNTGTFNDVGADIVSVTASVGTVTQIGTQNGTWNWTFLTTDGPDDTQSVTITATDDDGAFSTTTFPLTVNNVAPTTDAGPDATINEGDTFVSAGSFTDPGADTWTATVDYDDGAGPQPLALNPDMSFVLSRTYADDGIFTVTVTVTDDDGGVGVDTAVVTVENLPPVVDANLDGPDESQTVVITATDSDGASSTTSFDLIVLNVPPVANDDTYNTDEDTPLNVSVADGVLDNDTDAGLDSLSAAVVTPPSNGTLSLNLDGSFTYTPDPNWFGTDTFIYSATDDDLASDTATVTINVAPVNDPPVLSVDIATQTVQYSDGISPVTITAADVDSVLPPLSLTHSGTPASLSVSAGICAVDNTVPAGQGSSCTWTLSGNVTVGANTYPINFTVDDGALEFNTDDASTEVVVVQENATGLMDSANPTAVIVDGDGSDSSSPFSLRVFVSETMPDVAANGLTAAGDIGLANVSMSLAPVGPGSLVTPTSCDLPILTGSGYTGVLEVTCHFSGVPVNTYSANVTIDGDYYTGAAEDVVTIYDPSLGFATGGGWFYWPGTMDKTNYGFTMKYGKNGRNVKGNLLIIRHLADGTNHRFKSNALGGLAVGESGDPSFGWASFNGKGTYREPGAEDAVGNHEFTTYVEDHGEPGGGADRVWIQVLDKDDLVVPGLSIDPQATDNAVLINGGNIVVPHTNSGGMSSGGKK
jgi:hypothetical protein